jgi:prolyl oligopeptidase
MAVPDPPATTQPPVAAIRPVVDTYFGVAVSDPYRWMEQPSAELTDWMKRQNDFTRRTLDALPGRAELLARLFQLDDDGDQVSSVSRRRSKTFLMRRAPGEEVSKLFIRDAPAGPLRLLIDPAALGTADHHFTLDDYTPSPDGSHVAYKLSPGGSENGAIQVLDAATGKPLPESIDRVLFGSVSWIDEHRFLYNRLRKAPPGTPPGELLKGIVSFQHILGTDAEKDVAVLGPRVNLAVPVQEDMFPLTVSLPRTGHGEERTLGILLDGVREEKTYLVASGPLGAKSVWKKVADPDRDQVTWAEAYGDDLYLLTHRDAPRFQVVKTRLSHPDLAHATVVVPESDLVLESIVVAKDALYVAALDAGIGRLLRVAHGGATVERVVLPVDGRLSELSADASSPGAWFQLSSWAVSPRIEQFDPATGHVTDTGLVAPSRADFSRVVAEETVARSGDGTQVPLSIIHLADLPRDGARPTWLRGYGSYGRSELPEFSATLLAWLERGGVYAVCHVRGGGERGDAWHKGGMLLQKEHTFEDYFGCAEHLIAERYTSPQHLAGEGTSAGGITIGGAITRRPELFGAALILLGVSNALRFEQTENIFNTPEFGSVKTEDGFKALTIADAYSHVTDGGCYPPVLLTTGVNDVRVAPWQATKMAARLQAASRGGVPVLLRVADDAGHDQGRTRQQRDAELADEYAFLLSQLGSPTPRACRRAP